MGRARRPYIGKPRIEPFEEHAARYDEWFELHKYAYESELLALRELVPESSKGVEIGVGSGRFAAPLSLRFGVEPSIKMGKIAKMRGIDVVRGVAEALPFADTVFDLALMVTTICFIDDMSIAFREASRILKPAGTFVTAFVDRDSPIGRTYQRRKEENPFYRVAAFRSAKEVLLHLRQASFRALESRQTIFHDLSDLNSVEEPSEGYGVGSFVAIKATSTAAG